jgi:hypothetical protein
MKGGIPEITFSANVRAPMCEARGTSRASTYLLPQSYLTRPEDGLAWLRNTSFSMRRVEVAGALLHTGCVTLRELEEGSPVTWEGLFTCGVPWLNHLAKQYGEHILVGGAKTTIVDLLKSPDGEIRVFAQMLLSRMPEPPTAPGVSR